jgi:single-strand DNA-binding protein
MSRSLNKVELIGNLTRDPELRFTPSGAAVCTFGLATNRQWNTDSGEKKEEVEFHRIVAWNKLAELCGQLLAKGRKVYVEGRLQTRKWTGQDNTERITTEIVISDMIILDSRSQADNKSSDVMDVPENLDEVLPPIDESVSAGVSTEQSAKDDAKTSGKVDKTKSKKEEEKPQEDDDIPF